MLLRLIVFSLQDDWWGPNSNNKTFKCKRRRYYRSVSSAHVGRSWEFVIWANLTSNVCNVAYLHSMIWSIVLSPEDGWWGPDSKNKTFKCKRHCYCQSVSDTRTMLAKPHVGAMRVQIRDVCDVACNECGRIKGWGSWPLQGHRRALCPLKSRWSSHVTNGPPPITYLGQSPWPAWLEEALQCAPFKLLASVVVFDGSII